MPSPTLSAGRARPWASRRVNSSADTPAGGVSASLLWLMSHLETVDDPAYQSARGLDARCRLPHLADGQLEPGDVVGQGPGATGLGLDLDDHPLGRLLG